MFTSKELSQIPIYYFKKLKECDSFIGLQSKNTEHCWIIKKIYNQEKFPILLYHKHSIINPYYHKHSRTFSVNQAIRQIISHDEYFINNKCKK